MQFSINKINFQIINGKIKLILREIKHIILKHIIFNIPVSKRDRVKAPSDTLLH